MLFEQRAEKHVQHLRNDLDEMTRLLCTTCRWFHENQIKVPPHLHGWCDKHVSEDLKREAEAHVKAQRQRKKRHHGFGGNWWAGIAD